MTAAQVSIVLPVFNGARYLEEAIASVRAQAFRDWELLLIDDGSTDGSVELLRREASVPNSRIRYLEHPGHENRGALATRVLGAKSAESVLLALLDQDDVWDRNYLEDHVARWLRADDPELGVSYGPGLYWYPDSLADNSVQELPEGSPALFRPGELLPAFLASEYRNTPCPSCTLIRREALLQAERFASAAWMSHCEDQYLWWSAALRWSVAVHAEPRVRYRQHAESALATQVAIPGRAARAQLTFLELIHDDVAAVRPDHPVLAELAARIERFRPTALPSVQPIR